MHWIKQFVSLLFILWIEIYPVDSAIQRLNNSVPFAQYVFVFINFDLPTTDYSLFFFPRILAGLLVLGGVLGGVLGWYFTRSRDKSLGGPYKQAVATDNEKCSEIGNKILNSNGSAVDAAIAAMFCLGVINMQSSGVGGGGVMLIYNRTLKKAKVIDFKGTAPAATTSDMFPPTESGKNMSIYGKYYFSFSFLPPAVISPRRRNPKEAS